MKLPFKKGDIVRFVGSTGELGWLSKDKISSFKTLTIVECKEDENSWGGISVRIKEDTEDREWDVSWFELDKKSIIKAILEDL